MSRFLKISLTSWLVLLALLFSEPVYAKVVIKTPKDDAYVDKDAPDGYMGLWSPQKNHVKTMAGTSSGIPKSRKSYLRYDMSSISRKVTSASLTFQISQTDVTTWHTIDVYGLTNATSGETTWTDDGITWNNAPANDTASISGFTSNAVFLGSFTVDASKAVGDTFVYTVSQDFLDFINDDTNGQITIMLSSQIATLKNVSFAANENEDYAPVKLILHESDEIEINNPSDDAYIDRDAPDGYMGAWSPQRNHLKTLAGTSSGTPKSRKSYLRFDLSSINQKIVGASLTFQISETNVTTWHDIGIYGLIDGVTGETTWADDGITWNNAPGNDTGSISGFTSDAVYLGTITVDSSKSVGDTFTYNASPDFVNFLNSDTNGQVTIMLSSLIGTLQNVSLASNENTEYAPVKLTLKVSEKADQHNLLVYLEATQYDRWNSWQTFKPYVGYLDKSTDTAQDWFFSNYCFLQYGGAPSGGNYFNGNCNKADWLAFLDQLFTANKRFDALSQCVDQVALELNDQNRDDVVITIMLPYLLRDNTSFGDVDGDGQNENTSNSADRLKIYHWYIDELLSRWQDANYDHLQLWGFYWIKEGMVHEDDYDEVQDIFAYVHQLGYKMQWMPWYQSPGHEIWSSLGFDSVDMQPNYAMKQPLPGAVLANNDRMSECANLCRSYGMNLVMELVERYYRDPAEKLNAWLYFNHGLNELDGYLANYMGGWYQDYNIIAKYYNSGRAEENVMYDDCYNVVKGTYSRKHVSLCHGKDAKLNGTTETKLTDGLWMTRGERTDRIIQTSDSVTIDIDMESVQPLGDVRLHVTEDEAAGLYPPEEIKVYSSRDGTNYTYVARQTVGTLLDWGERKGGFVCINWKAQLGRYLRLEVTGKTSQSMGLGEVCVFPCMSPLWGLWPEVVSGTLEIGIDGQDTRKLNDSRIVPQSDTSGQVRFTSGSATVKYTPWDEDVILGKAWAHVWYSGTAPSMRILAIDSDLNEYYSSWTTPDSDGWICIDLPGVKCKTVRFQLSGDASAGWDELSIQKIDSLAKGKPYVISPLYNEILGDPNRTKLTDGYYQTGSLSSASVGWSKSEKEAKILIEFPQNQSINSVKVFAFEGDAASVSSTGVNYPDILSVELSSDGENWVTPSAITRSRIVDSNANITGATGEWAWMTASFASQTCRFVRLGVSRVDNWIILNEVQILSNSTNVAQGLDYYLTPGPRASDTYGDIRGDLTNTFYVYPYARTGSWGTVAGWNTGTPEVTIDLLSAKAVSAVCVHCIGGGTEFYQGDPGNGAFLPSSVEVSVSTDGTNWTQLGTLQGYDLATQITSRLSYRKSLLVEGQSQNARYIKIKLTHYQGWIIVDEIEVFNE